jgi:hypothetical protein
MRRFAALLAAISLGVCVAAGQPGSFTLTDSLLTPRQFHTLTLLRNGRAEQCGDAERAVKAFFGGHMAYRFGGENMRFYLRDVSCSG